MKFAEILKEAITTKAYAMARSMAVDPLQSFRFRVSLTGPYIVSGIGFQKVAGLSRETAVVEYLENTYDHTHKLPGRESVGEITFEKGIVSNGSFSSEDLYESVFNSSNRYTATIEVCDRYGIARRSFTLNECWFSKYEVGDLDATSDDVLIETLTMQFESFL